MKKVILALATLTILLGAAGAQGLASLDAIPGLQPGSILVLTVTGNAAGGSVWGTDLYTTDSSLAAAAVHAGVLYDKVAGTVIVEVLAGAASYDGSNRNGVTSQKWGSFGKSFRFRKSFGTQAVTQPTTSTPMPPLKIYAFEDAATLNRIKPVSGAVVYIKLTGSGVGSVWGTDVYTIDSAPAAVAVHAGILRIGQSGIMKVRILPGRTSYEGSSRNGVNTMSYAAYGASYSVEAVPPGAQVLLMIADPGSVQNIPGAAPGQTIAVWVAGLASGGSIWGSDIYTADSSLARAAVHAGLIGDGAAGTVIVQILPGRASYEGSTRYGVASSAYGSYGMSYSLSAAQ
jgi:hypothetical protein